MGYYLAYCVAAKERRPAIIRRMIRCSRQLDRLVQLERGLSPWSTATMPEAASHKLAIELMSYGA